MKVVNAIKLPSVMHLLRRLCGRGQPQAAVPASPAPADELPADDDSPRACGWFDSSHDLQHGLRVQEHLSADSLAHELPLGVWLDLQLSGWRQPEVFAAAA